MAFEHVNLIQSHKFFLLCGFPRIDLIFIFSPFIKN
jgi:hypothetical protein